MNGGDQDAVQQRVMCGVSLEGIEKRWVTRVEKAKTKLEGELSS